MIRAAREGGWERVVAVFQPHRYTRTAALWRDFADAFTGADALVLTDVYAGRRGTPARRLRAARAPGRARRAPRDWPSPTCPRRADLVATCPASPARATSCSPSAPATSPPCPTSGWRPRRDRGPAGSRRSPGWRDALAAAGVPVERGVPVGRPHHLPRRRPAGGAGPGRLDGDARPRSAGALADGLPPLLVVGRGSNLLVADAGFPGLGVVLGREFETIDLDADRTPSGPARRCRSRSWPAAPRRPVGRGLEFFVGIPGSVGGAVRMNAGGHGRETADVLLDAEVVDLAAGEAAGPTARPAADLAFGYRRVGRRPDRGRVTGATFRSRPATAPSARRASPRSCAGGASTSPAAPTRVGVPQPAGRLRRPDHRRAAGSRACGSAARWCRTSTPTSSRPRPAPRADDVRGLVAEVRRRVLDATGVALVPELRMVGFDDDGPGGGDG